MKIFIDIDNNNRVIGWGISPPSDNAIEIEVSEDHPVLMEFGKYLYIDGELIQDLSHLLEEMKRDKDKELNKACQQAILNGFTHVIDGVEYHFSFDQEAQLNFQGAESLLNNGIIDEIKWTVRKNDEYTRITINKEVMSELSLTILLHKAENIARYRDELLPKVQQATTIEEIKNIKW